MQNSAFWTRVTSLYGSQTWPVVLCMYNSGLNIRITSLYGSQPSSTVFACKTAWLASESLVSMGPSPLVWFLDAKQRLMDWNNKSLSPRHNRSFCACKTAWFALEWQVYMGSSTHLCFFPCKTATLWPDLQVWMGPRSHLWFWAHITACWAQE